jgi:hypothetical protein
MSSMTFIAQLDIYFHGLLHIFKDAGVFAGCLTDMHNAMVKCFFIVNRICIHKRVLGVQTGKNPEDLYLVSVGVMQ